MMVEAGLPDVDDGEVKVGMAARCTLDAHSDLVLTGRVVEVGPIARRAEGRGLRRHFPVRIALDGGDPERMRPGMSVKVEVLGEPAAQPEDPAVPEQGVAG
jgi:multidrug resistance efflux pump